jgi:hypothetical protein
MKIFWYTVFGFTAGIIFSVIFWVLLIPLLNRMLQ